MQAPSVDDGSARHVELFGYDSLPFANAGPDQTVYGCGTCLGVATLDASGTLDGDDDLLTYTWSEGTRTLATTTDPIKVVTLSFGLGIHTVTLTVTDGAGAVSTDSVVITVRDIVGISSSELAQCRADMAVLEAELAAHVAAIEQNFRQEFGDSQFVIPGGSRRAQLQNVVSAIVAMNRGQKRTLYRSLGGQ